MKWIEHQSPRCGTAAAAANCMNSRCSSALMARSVRRLRNWNRSFSRRSRSRVSTRSVTSTAQPTVPVKVPSSSRGHLAAALEPAHRPVGPDRPVLEVVRAEAGDRLVDLGEDAVDLVGVQRRLPRLERRAELPGGQPRERLEGGVPTHLARRRVPTPGPGLAGGQSIGQEAGHVAGWGAAGLIDAHAEVSHATPVPSPASGPDEPSTPGGGRHLDAPRRVAPSRR